MHTFSMSTASYAANSDLFAAVVKASLKIMPLFPFEADPAFAALPSIHYVAPLPLYESLFPRSTMLRRLLFKSPSDG